MTSRNAPCPCGSGKKYKRCCGATGVPGDVPQPPPGARWEVDLVPMPASIRDQPGARPAAALVVADGLPIGVELVPHPPAEPFEVAEILADAVEACTARHGAPPVVRVRQAGLAADLADQAALAGIRVESGPLPELDPVAADFLREVAGAEHPMPTASGAEMWRAWGLPNPAIADLFRAAADFHRAAPWRVVLNQQIVQGVLPGGRAWWACILGNGGAEFGLALYQERDDFLRQLEAPSPDLAFAAFHGAMLSLVFCTQAELPRRMRKEILSQGWPVAGPDAYPALFVVNTPGGGVSRSQAADLAIMLRAVPPFVAAHRAALLRRRTPAAPIEWPDPATGVLVRYEGVAGDPLSFMGEPPERLAPALAQGPGSDPAAALPVGAKPHELRHNLELAAAFSAALQDAGLGRQTIRRHTDNAALFAGFVGAHGVPLRAVTEYDLREFLYNWVPTVAAPVRTRADTLAIPMSLAKFAAFLEDEADLSLPWAGPILADRATFGARLDGAPPEEAQDRDADRWLEALGNDLDGRGLLPDVAMAEGERWRTAADMGPDEALLWHELQRRWLLWRDEAVAAGITDPADLRAALLPRQRNWELAPHSEFNGWSPLEVVRGEHARRA